MKNYEKIIFFLHKVKYPITLLYKIPIKYYVTNIFLELKILLNKEISKYFHSIMRCFS